MIFFARIIVAEIRLLHSGTQNATTEINDYLPDFEELDKDEVCDGGGCAPWTSSTGGGRLSGGTGGFSTAKRGGSAWCAGGLNPANRGAGVAGRSIGAVANPRGQSRLAATESGVASIVMSRAWRRATGGLADDG
jgi:hypothetical protein